MRPLIASVCCVQGLRIKLLQVARLERMPEKVCISIRPSFYLRPVIPTMKARRPDNRPSQPHLTYLKVSSKVLGSLFSSLNAGTIMLNDLVASLKMDEAGICTV